MKLRRAFAPLALLAALAGGAIVAAQPGSRDRHRTVAGWLVEDAAEEDGGRLVRMTRTSGPYRLEYHAAFWHGNDGVIQHVSAIGAGCGGSGALDRHLIFHVSEIRARLAAGLAECAASRGAVHAALRGLEPAYFLASAWSRDAAAATAAEAAAIAGYGAAGNGDEADPCAGAPVDAAENIAGTNEARAC